MPTARSAPCFETAVPLTNRPSALAGRAKGSIPLIARSCPICGPQGDPRPFAEANFDLDALDGFAFASRKLPEYMHWRLVECGRCDVLYAAEAPRLEDLARLYHAADFDSASEARYASQTYGRRLESIGRQLPDRDGAVDVGTGDGVFLRELLAAGYTGVVGVEPSEAPILSADPEIRPLIRHDIFRSDSFAPGSLSLVTCFQTIEHLSDPLAFCCDAFRMLKSGGCLYLIGHNRRAFSARVLGRKSPIFDVEHLQLFSPRSMAGLLRMAGFPRIEVGPILNRYPVRYWARLFPFPSAVKRQVLRLLRSSKAGGAPIPLPAGNLAAVAFKS
ncbi:MAG: class I SAM-dependent methyltransferase [Isosphaeraceae bacterium]